MKKGITLLLVAIMATIQFAQSREVFYPSVKASNFVSHQIVEVELTTEFTKIYFDAKVPPKSWFRFVPETYLVADNGQSYKVRSADGLTLGKNCIANESGRVLYALEFEPLPLDTRTIDLDERTRDGYKIAGIYVGEEPKPMPVEESLMGSWYSVDGSGRFLLGFYDSVVLYRNDMWRYDVDAEPQRGAIELINNSHSEQRVTLYYKKGKRGDMLFGESKKKLQTLSQTRTFNNDYPMPTNVAQEWTRESFFKAGKATIRGYFADYSDKVYDQRAMTYVRSCVAEQDDKMKMIDINPDGTFELELDLLHPISVLVNLGNRMFSIFASPGETITMMIPINNVVSIPGAFYKRKANEIRYMGDEGLFNTQVARYMALMPGYDSQKYFKNFDVEQYKVHIDKRWESDMAHLKSYVDTTKFIPNVERYITNYTKMEIGCDINDYKSQRAYHQKVDYQTFKVPASLYRRFRDLPLDDFRILANDGIYFFINGLQFFEFSKWAAQKEINGYFTSRGLDLKNGAHNIAYIPLFYATKMLPNYKERLGLDQSFATDVAALNFLNPAYLDAILTCDRDESESLLDEFVGCVESPIIKQIIIDRATRRRAEIIDQIVDARVKRGVSRAIQAGLTSSAAAKSVETTPAAKPQKPAGNKDKDEVAAAKLIAEKLAPLKGDVVLLDFWAMWCGPCRSGMLNSYKLKGKMEDYQMSFAYITTEHNSPKSSREKFFKENKIDGTSLVVTNDEWALLASVYDISGIPRYMLIDKEGNVIDPKYNYYGADYDKLRKLAGER